MATEQNPIYLFEDRFYPLLNFSTLLLKFTASYGEHAYQAASFSDPALKQLNSSRRTNVRTRPQRRESCGQARDVASR